MAELYSTIKPAIVIRLLLISQPALYFMHKSAPYSYAIAGFAAILGVIVGITHFLAFKEAEESLPQCDTLRDLARAIKKTKWGKKYSYVSLIALLIIIAVVALTGKGDFMSEATAGILAFLVASDLFTLKPKFEFADLKKKQAGPPVSRKEW